MLVFVVLELELLVYMAEVIELVDVVVDELSWGEFGVDGEIGLFLRVVVGVEFEKEEDVEGGGEAEYLLELVVLEGVEPRNEGERVYHAMSWLRNWAGDE